MKTAFAIVAVAIIALYLRNNQSPQAAHVGKREAANESQTTSKMVEAEISAPRSTNIVVAPMPKIGLKTGPNAQTELKTGPDAQNVWNQPSTAPTALKTGPNAQTDLTLKRSW